MRVALLHNLAENAPQPNPDAPHDILYELDHPKNIEAYTKAIEAGGHEVFPMDGDALKSGTGLKEIPFTIRGIVHGLSNASYIVYANLNYLQNVLNNQGRVSFTYIKVDDPFLIPQICRKLEELFHNYPVETTTITQKSFMDSIVDKIKPSSSPSGLSDA